MRWPFAPMNYQTLPPTPSNYLTLTNRPLPSVNSAKMNGQRYMCQSRATLSIFLPFLPSSFFSFLFFCFFYLLLPPWTKYPLLNQDSSEAFFSNLYKPHDLNASEVRRRPWLHMQNSRQRSGLTGLAPFATSAI
jgi:hypothetical protein